MLLNYLNNSVRFVLPVAEDTHIHTSFIYVLPEEQFPWEEKEVFSECPLTFSGCAQTSPLPCSQSDPSPMRTASVDPQGVRMIQTGLQTGGGWQDYLRFQPVDVKPYTRQIEKYIK